MEENSKWERGSDERGRKGGARGRARDNGACHEGPANPDFPVPVSRRRLLIYTKRRWAGWKTAARTPRMATHTGSTRHGFWRLDTRSRCQRGVWELTGPLYYKTSLAPRFVTRGIFHKPPPPLPTQKRPALCRMAVAHAVRCGQWQDAVDLELRFAASCEGSGARNSQAKAFLGAVVVWLHAGQAKQAWAVYQVPRKGWGFEGGGRVCSGIAGRGLEGGGGFCSGIAGRGRGVRHALVHHLKSLPPMESGTPVPARLPDQDALAVDAFSSSDEAFAAEALFNAYRTGIAANVAAAIKQHPCFLHMDASVARLAKKLHEGAVQAIEAALPGGPGAVDVAVAANGEEDLT